MIPEPEKSDNIVENGVKTDKKERSNSSVGKSNISAPEQQGHKQQSTTSTLTKKGKQIKFFLLYKQNKMFRFCRRR